MVTLIKYNGDKVENYVQYESKEDVPLVLFDEYTLVVDETIAEKLVEEFNEKQKAEQERQAAVPTTEERIEAQVMYTALMTDTLLEGE